MHQASDGTPHSGRYDDVYFHPANGLEESRYVFLEHNRLQERFANLPSHGTFTIAETGFGTGLNFLATWQLFNECAPPNARLVFISTERYPLRTDEIQACLEPWPELKPLLSAFLHNYPALFEGFHLIEPDGRVDLLLLLGDANDTLPELNAQVDAWFLDGFTPSRNPDLWRPGLFTAMARMSHEGTTAATFSSARPVYEGLTGAGFQVKRTRGYGKKRNMIQARFMGLCGPKPPGFWPANEWHWPRMPSRTERRAVVVGAGLAGAHTAWELASRGWRVTVLEQAPTVASGASGNAQGAVYARLSHDDSAANRFYSQALELAQFRLAALPDAVTHEVCGLLQLNQGQKEAKRFERFRHQVPYPADFVRLVDPVTADRTAGVPLGIEALYFPGGGWTNPPELVAHLLEDPNIDVRAGHQVTGLDRTGDGWRLTVNTAGSTDWLETDQVILTSAWETNRLSQASYLPLQPIAGQVTQIETQPSLCDLKTVLCSDRYLVPAHEGVHCLGATFHLKQNQAIASDADDADNLKALRERLPQLVQSNPKVVASRAGIRCASPDYLPQVGPLVEPEAFINIYGRALQKRLTRRLPAPPWHNGLWVNIAHGSKGLCSVPLAAKTLAAWLNGEPLPIPQTVANHLNPNRFLIRAMIRGKQ